LFLIALLSFCTFFCFLFSIEGSGNPFIGTWQLVSGEYINGENKIVDYADADINSIKVLSANYYSFISISGDKFWVAGRVIINLMQNGIVRF